MTTAAQNMHGLLRKLPLRRNHFFEWLKTAVLLIDCGTSTLKSLLSLGPDAPHVHLRLRKRLSRCTLDCGFKTSESPALRGFVGGLRALATAALYLVLKSNGFHHPKNQLKKFEFSLKTTSMNFVKKLRNKHSEKPFLISIFNSSHKWLTFAFTPEIEYTLGSSRKIAHSALHAETRGFTIVQPRRAFDRPSSGKRTAGGSGCTPTACVRFLRRRSPAGLRNTLFNLSICISHARRTGISTCARQRRYHYPRRTPHILETPGARLSKQLTCRFLRSGGLIIGSNSVKYVHFIRE